MMIYNRYYSQYLLPIHMSLHLNYELYGFLLIFIELILKWQRTNPLPYVTSPLRSQI
jgi:hypothetical protein